MIEHPSERLFTECSQNMDKIHRLMAGKIVTQLSACPLKTENVEEEFREASKADYNRYKIMDNCSAKYWPTLVVFVMTMLHDDEKISPAIVATFFAFVFLTLLDKQLGYAPGSDIINLAIVDENRKHACKVFSRYKHVKVKANNSMQGLMPLVYPQTRAHFFQQQLPYFMQYSINQGLFSLEHDAYDCVSASALLVLQLINAGIHHNYKIERFYRIGNTEEFPHSFVVVNRETDTVTKGNNKIL